MKTILITGGAGFIGSAFTHYIYNTYPDYKIIVLDALTYAGKVENLPVTDWELQDERFTFWYGNVLNGELVDTLVSQSDMVVHFAAESHVTRSIYDNSLFFQTDVLGTQTIANAVCKYKDRVQRFVHISTSEVYGTAESAAMNEEHPLNPLSPYAAAKCGADRLVYSYFATYKIPAVIVRPFNNYGPRQHLEKVIPRFVTSVMLGERLRVHGDGQSSRDFIFVEDTCRAVDLILHAPAEKVEGEVFNVGSGVHRSILSLAQDVTAAMCQGKNCYINVGDRPGQVMRHTADASKIKRVLGFTPAVSWEEGLKKTIDWYKDNEDWWRKQIWMREIPIVSASGKRELH
ncbi:dTDP-glucose 4,6-dehydratase [Fundidesulfovibrio agrisoli]|uniref:dTDP-glucose 4,6-dehydratase n=1 Tax=Fundidesulfovibrio agrisoli TaxID=2922717 RepID=UPI001FAE3633